MTTLMVRYILVFKTILRSLVITRQAAVAQWPEELTNDPKFEGLNPTAAGNSQIWAKSVFLPPLKGKEK